MTVSGLLRYGISFLKDKDIPNYSNEARWILEAVLSCTREYIVFHGDKDVDRSAQEDYLSRLERRAKGEPVQYVIGIWDFYGEKICVGKGVLIPRPETELLVDFAIEYLKGKKNPVVYDLCSGSGCVGLSVAVNVPDATVYLIEKSDDAFRYLEKNIELSACKNVRGIKGDIFDGFEKFNLPEPDVILSNPPYIESKDISSLQSEVLREPIMALDGGEDGYDFYTAINDKWLPYCKGAIAVECGEGQAETIEDMFSSHCGKTYSVTDFNDIKRAVIGYVGTERK